jgi:hypothetical protein
VGFITVPNPTRLITVITVKEGYIELQFNLYNWISACFYGNIKV